MVTEQPAVADSRDILVQAIGAEAQHVADTFPGQVAAALEQLARAYALVAGPAAVEPALRWPPACWPAFWRGSADQRRPACGTSGLTCCGSVSVRGSFRNAEPTVIACEA